MKILKCRKTKVEKNLKKKKRKKGVARTVRNQKRHQPTRANGSTSKKEGGGTWCDAKNLK